MHITVVTLSETAITLNVDRFDTILKIKELIAQQSGIPERNQSLLFASVELNDKLALADYNISDGSTLRLQMSTSLQKLHHTLLRPMVDITQSPQSSSFKQHHQPPFYFGQSGQPIFPDNKFVRMSKPDPITGFTPL